MSDGRSRGAAAILRAVIERARDEWIGFLAAAVAYYALVSIVPLTALIALAVATVAGDAVAGWVLAALGDTLSGAGQEAIRRGLTTATARSQATVVGLLVLLWGGSRLFRGLDRAFGRVYRTDDGTDTVGHARDTVLVLVGVLSMVVAVATVGAAAVAIALAVATELDQLRSLAEVRTALDGMMDGAVGVVAQVVLIVALLFPVYYVLPNVPVTVRDAVPGTVIAAVGWTVLFAGFDLYVGLASGSALSGVLGGVVVVVTLLYVASFLLLVGAVVNAVLAEA
ncbi:YihY/virulence factor BrkB family protein [Halobaculum rubrum]|uniref:YihY/virulence factor BrkB family protein n=1 Tax=Halobaculum rubrum TaxID=2872158 RepID=UPI001CA3C045|nr:YihY/virulence factor BrkB family protein [Halobaculum rubrum]QZX98873.1 YihY/virulence factor BrkB family protein [Halobaculum rubrum]